MTRIKYYILSGVMVFMISLSYGQDLSSLKYKDYIKAFQSQLNHFYSDEEKSPLSDTDRAEFVSHDFFPINPSYRVVATLDKSSQGKKIKFKTSTARKPAYKLFARAIFSLDGKEMGLNIYRNAKSVKENPEDNVAFLPFNDLTNGVETYGGGRYIDIDLDLKSDTVIIDFNKSYNPYCAYSDRYSCPVPPKENNLEVLIKAGIRLNYYNHNDMEHEDKEAMNSTMVLTLDQANLLAQLPLDCITQEYPNRLGQTLGGQEDIRSPFELHPSFYGCFDWHSAVHGHWSLIKLIKDFPELNKAEEIRTLLAKNISKENILAEVAYFEGEHNTSYERTYGWAWLLKLALELHSWNDPLARELENNLEPLTDLIVKRYLEFLPKLNYPIRVGEHTNTAFGLSFAWDYAVEKNMDSLKWAISSRAKDFYLNDENCPLDWEPSGYDFLSPCFEEIDIMRRVLDPEEFKSWIFKFSPEVMSSNFQLTPGLVSDRTDGKLVHLDGLNFSRAWVMFGLAKQYPEYAHLVRIANEHIGHSYGSLVGDGYEGGHWLGSFALYALSQSK